MKGKELTRQDIIDLLKLDDFTPIYEEADRIKCQQKGKEVLIRAIIEYSSYCQMRCQYCGINGENRKAIRYRMSKDEILKAAFGAIDAGYRTIVLQGGEDPVFMTGEILEDVICEIKAKDKDVAITLSAGELSDEVLEKLKKAGANRFLLRHETADRELFARIHPGKTLEERVDRLRAIKSLGYETGSGFMVGIPGQSLESLADDLLLIKELSCDMAGMGPYIAHPDTPLAGNPTGSVELTMRCVAIARLLLPNANLPVTTAIGVLDMDKRNSGFAKGANVVMRKVTPEKYKAAYQIYPAKPVKTDIKKERNELEEIIKSMDLIPV
ncbi:MAG: [FeFe] hydrogenase H-cluster radical SAM maturase HydE [Anaerovoracaceae bacterium]